MVGKSITMANRAAEAPQKSSKSGGIKRCCGPCVCIEAGTGARKRHSAARELKKHKQYKVLLARAIDGTAITRRTFMLKTQHDSQEKMQH